MRQLGAGWWRSAAGGERVRRRIMDLAETYRPEAGLTVVWPRGERALLGTHLAAREVGTRIGGGLAMAQRLG